MKKERSPRAVMSNIRRGMIHRCTNPNGRSWHRYGGRGIKVCDRWLESLDAFIEDLGYRPSLGHSLDRIDNDGDYCPGNCRWATSTEQARNTSQTLWTEVEGKPVKVADVLDDCQFNSRTVRDRLKRGWSAERALSQPPFEDAVVRYSISFRGKDCTAKEFAKLVGFSTTYSVVKWLARCDWDPEAVVAELKRWYPAQAKQAGLL